MCDHIFNGVLHIRHIYFLLINVLFLTIDKTVEGSPIQLKETAFQRSSPYDTNKNLKHTNKT